MWAAAKLHRLRPRLTRGTCWPTLQPLPAWLRAGSSLRPSRSARPMRGLQQQQSGAVAVAGRKPSSSPSSSNARPVRLLQKQSEAQVLAGSRLSSSRAQLNRLLLLLQQQCGRQAPTGRSSRTRQLMRLLGWQAGLQGQAGSHPSGCMKMLPQQQSGAPSPAGSSWRSSATLLRWLLGRVVEGRVSAGSSPSSSEELMRRPQPGTPVQMQGPSVQLACSSSCQAQHRLSSRKATALLLVWDHMYTLELQCKPRRLCLSRKQSQREGG